MDIQSDMDCLNPNNDLRASVEDMCVTTKALYMSALKEPETQRIQRRDRSSQRHSSHLPKMNLPKFSGKHSEFKNFISLFESLVHNDPILSNVEKFNHLLSCLVDDALGTVKAFQISADNYEKALDSLKEVYDKKYFIFSDTVSQLFDIPSTTKASASCLRSLIDTVSAIYSSLQSLGSEKDINSAMLIHIALSKVDPTTKSRFEEQLDYDKLPSWSECAAQLNRRYQHLAAEESTRNKGKTKQETSKGPTKSSFSCAKTDRRADSKCSYCHAGNHTISNCQSFSALPVLQRFDITKQLRLCINCLRPGHTVTRCKTAKCRVCSKPHNTLLHRYGVEPQQNGPSSVPVEHSSSSEPQTAYSSHVASADQVILATAVVKVQDRSGQFQYARALLDSGSQINFISEDLAQRLRLRRDESCLNITTVGKNSSVIRHKIHTSVQSRINDHNFDSDFWVLRSISTYQPDHVVNFAQWKIPANLQMADPQFYKPAKVDLLIGAETFFDLMCVGQLKASSEHPTIQKTLLGWIVSGKYKASAQDAVCNIAVGSDHCSLDSLVERFWELEQVPEKSKAVYTAEQLACEQNFKQTLRRLESGRFEVGLPFKINPVLGFSFETAKSRFLSLERRLARDQYLHDLYMEFSAVLVKSISSLATCHCFQTLLQDAITTFHINVS
ncbi:uncharacterized protein LOC117192220 [Drosophila miranda]|uniref:uncharacterized protein LOC117192220 n=1 Tax=Drosophila miranda TaxID=7229 RepID=UPI00143FB80C|nr:uncharacterized protein LOC117192220 [Drosophila miranda]